MALIIALVVLLVAGAGGAVLLLKSNNKKETTTGSSATTAAPTSAPSPTPSPSPTVLAPSSVSATDVGALAVTLSWTPPLGGDQPERYTIYRDDEYLDSVVAPATTYTDETVLPGKTYSYEVRAVLGSLESPGVPTVVHTPVPPLDDARVQGDFNVKVALVSQTGYISYNHNFTLGWHFKPKCDTGACNVVWTDLYEKSFKATLVLKNGNYTGSDSGDFGSTCNGVHHNSTLTLDFHVTKAKVMNGEWRATKLVGTLEEDDPAQLGCVTGHADLNTVSTLLS